MKRRIRLNESQLQTIVRRCVKSVLNESDLKYRQLVNMFGSDVPDEWNVAAEHEDKEELEGEIWRAISNELCNGGNPRECTIHFNDLVELVKRYWFKFIGNDEQNHCIDFKSPNAKLSIHPQYFYPHMDEMRIFNTTLW